MTSSVGYRCIVVGDIYSSFSNQSNVLTETDVIERMQQGNFGFSEIICGQGLRQGSITTIQHLAQVRAIACVSFPRPLASRELTHKSNPDNILISKPLSLGDSTYEFQLVVADAVDRLSDHVTGEHLGAMLLIEAARQAGIATLELAFPNEEGSSWGFVLHSFNTSFIQYAFPLPTRVVIHIAEDVSEGARQRKISLDVKHFQQDQCVSVMTIGVSLYQKKLLTKLERMRSHDITQKLLDVDIEAISL